MGLEHIDAGAFCNLRNISTLNLDGNRLRSPPELCALKCCLVTLLLADNKISILGKDYFEGYTKLKRLHLGHNGLVQLPDLHWIQNSLTHILADNNKIKSFDMFKTRGVFDVLYYISMGMNYIHTFNVTILRHMPNLRTFILNNNKLTHIDDFRPYYKKVIRLTDNHWHCGMALSWMGKDDMEFEHDLTCETPACLKGTPIADMSK